MRLHLRFGLVVALMAGFACEDPAQLTVSLRTDLRAEREFTRIEAVVNDNELALIGEIGMAALPDDYLRGVVVGDVPTGSTGSHRVMVRLYDDASTVVASAQALVDVRGRTNVTVVVSGACRGVVCPGEGDAPEALACIAGRCEDPRCTPETPDFCSSRCDADSDCEASIACATSLCASGQCFESLDDSRCGGAETCEFVTGCSGGCEPSSEQELECHDGSDDDCDGQVDCADADCRAGIETECGDGVDDDCDGDVDCADTDCDTLSCDDGVFCDGEDVCGGGVCVPASESACSAACDESGRVCLECDDDAGCGSIEFGEWSPCDGFTGACGESGTRTRTVSTPTCQPDNSCARTETIEMEACTRDQDGVRCAERVVRDWGGCQYDDTCDESGEQSRNIIDRFCRDGACETERTTQTRSCERSRLGEICGSSSVDGAPTNKVCITGACRQPCWRNDGSVSCSTLCGWARMSCVGYTNTDYSGPSTNCGSRQRSICYGR